MRLFSEEVTPTFTSSNLNILTVEHFTEVFFDVYELEINGKKYVTEKVAEYKGSPVINIQITSNGKNYTAPCVLNRGSFSFLVNEQTFQYTSESPDIDDVILEDVKSDEVDDIVFEKHESILEDIQRAKRSAKDYLVKLKEQHEAELTKSRIKNSKRFRRELEATRNDLVEEFLQIATNNSSDLYKSNEELKQNILENVKSIVSSLEQDVINKTQTLETLLDEKFESLTSDIVRGVLAKEIKESRQIVTDSINNVLNAVDDKLTTIDKANIELNNSITKSSNKALSRIGNVKTQLQEEIAKNIEVIQHDISKSVDKIKSIYDSKIQILSDDNNKLNEATKKECIKLVTESRDSLLSVINDIKVEVPNIIIEKEGKPFKEIDIKKVKAELEKNITSRFTSEMASIKRMIELMSGGGSVAQQFADGGVMNGNLTVVGAISAAQYLGITGGGGGGDFLPLSGGTITGSLSVFDGLSANSLNVANGSNGVNTFTSTGITVNGITNAFGYQNQVNSQIRSSAGVAMVFRNADVVCERETFYVGGLDGSGTVYGSIEGNSGTINGDFIVNGNVDLTGTGSNQLNATYQNTITLNGNQGISLNSDSGTGSGFVSISGANNVTIAGGVLNFNSSDFAYASGKAALHRTALGLGTTDSPTFSSITTTTATFNTVSAAEYDLTGSDGFITTSTDIRTWVRGTNEFYVGGEETQPQGLTFKPDGSMMFVTGQMSDRVHRYVLSTPWDTTTAELSGNALVTATGGAPTAMYFTSDGLYMFILDQGQDRVGRYSLSPAWDVSTATLDSGQSKVLTTISGMPAGASFDPRGLEFSPDGKTLFVSDDSGNRIYQISLEFEWDLTSTMSLVTSYLIATTIDNALKNISFNNDGTRLFVAGNTNTRIYEFKLTSPYTLVDGVSYVGRTQATAADTNLGGMYYNDNAQKCFYVGNSGDTVREFIATPQPAIIGTRPILIANPASVDDRVVVSSMVISDSTATAGGTTGALVVNGGIGVAGEIACTLYGGTTVRMSTNGYIGFTNSSRMTTNGNGILMFSNAAENDLDRIQLGGTTASFPAIKRNGSGIDIRDAADAGYTTLAAGTFVVNNNIVTQSDNFTLSGADAGKYIRLTKSTGTQTITLTGTDILTGHEFTFYRATSATLALNGGTVNGGSNISSVPQNGAFALKHLGSGTFDFI